MKREVKNLSDDLKKDFAWVAFKKYNNYCNRNEQELSIQGFCLFCIESGIISERTVGKLMVMELYPHKLAECAGKIAAVDEIAEMVHVHPNTVLNMVNNPERYRVK